MRKSFLFTIGTLLVPFTVLALDYSNSTDQYADAPFALADRAAISVLTNLGVVEGYPDGTFQPGRTLNRAEFLKIVIGSSPHVRVVPAEDADACFPDVGVSDWFSPYVCLAKERDIVGGYPDGTFKPAQNVNYAEALKILTELYGYNTQQQSGEVWYTQYVRHAENHGTALPISLAYDAYLTRGQMARLAAAYRADHDGELDLYRMAERSISSAIAEQERRSGTGSSSSSASFVSSEASSSSVSSSSSSSAPEEEPLFPATSQFLMLGSLSPLVAGGTFVARDVPAEALNVRVTLSTEVESFEKLYLVNSEDVVLSTLTLDPYNTDSDKKKWVGPLEEGAITLTGTGMELGIKAQLYTRDSARSTPEELAKVQSFFLNVQPEIGDAYEAFPQNPQYPQHQVVQAEVDTVEAVGEDGVLVEGNGQLIGGFYFDATALAGAVPAVEHLSFTIESTDVSATNWYITKSGSPTTSPCAIDGVSIISCLNIPSQLGTIGAGGTLLELHANITFTGDNASIQASLLSPGAIGANGSVHWTDGVGHYTWVKKNTPVTNGPVQSN